MIPRLVVVLVMVALIGACAMALQRQPLCGPDVPEWLTPQCRKLAEERD